MIAAGGGSTATIQNQGTTSVSTSATTILTAGQYGSFCLVFGSDGTNRFMDVVLFGLGTGTVNVISSLSVAGSPSARTYTQSSSAYKLAMASGTYTVQVVAFTMSG
jgi:preprotein translocase subunit SecF